MVIGNQTLKNSEKVGIVWTEVIASCNSSFKVCETIS